MRIRINIPAFRQYFLIYLMLIVNQSNFYQYFIKDNTIVATALLLFVLFFLLKNHCKTSVYGTGLCALMLFFVVFNRILNGGIGVIFWYEMAIKILVVVAAVLSDREHFLKRFLKTVYVMAIISFVFWIPQLLGFPIQRYLLPTIETAQYRAIYDMYGNRSIVHETCSGLFLSSYISNAPTRNTGIYTEPGIYQMVLNSAIFMLLYMTRHGELSKKEQKKYFVIFSIVLLSTQSTTGYIGYIVLLISALLINIGRDQVRWRRYVLGIIFAGILVLSIDYALRGTDSLLSTAVLSKLFDSSNHLSLVAENSTGIYRIATIVIAIMAMVEHPLGLGVAGWDRYSLSSRFAGPGGFPFRLGAILGVIPFFVTLLWMFYPLKYLRMGAIAVLTYVFLYFNTSLAQTSAFYPALIVIPVCLILTRHHSRNTTTFSQN